MGDFEPFILRQPVGPMQRITEDCKELLLSYIYIKLEAKTGEKI